MATKKLEEQTNESNKVEKASASIVVEQNNAELDALKTENAQLQARIEKLERQLAAGKENGVHLNGRAYRIVHGPMAAKWILDEVKKGYLEEDRLVVALGE